MNTYAVVKSAGNSSVDLNPDTYTPLNAQVASRVHITNTVTGASSVQVKQDNTAAFITVRGLASMTFDGLRNASQISVLATTGTPTLSYRWEH